VKRVAVVAAAIGLAHAVPAVTVLRPTLFPGLAGRGDSGRVALTFDDGPDPSSTPQFLATLDRLDVRATFFVLGTMLARAPELGRELVAAGHEMAVHGWSHDNLLVRAPTSTVADLTRTAHLVSEVTGQWPRYFRPPYGVLTTSAIVAARRLDLRPVLWTCWGKDWRRVSTPDSVVRCVRSDLGPGGTILLHDSDCTSAPGSWRSTLAALPQLVEDCQRRGLRVGRLAEHFPRTGP
jgi:peptidoglycan/xylan/chitin deacetylase (PgdA/CDA1 family)